MRTLRLAASVLIGLVFGACSNSSTGSGDPPPACAASSECNGQVCINGTCSACQGNSECVAEFGATFTCQSGTCSAPAGSSSSAPASGGSSRASSAGPSSTNSSRASSSGVASSGATTCAALAATCAAQGRTCMTAGGSASCGACLPQFVVDGATCRAKITCSTLTCTGGCTENGPNADATCDPVSNCGTNEAAKPNGECTACTVPGHCAANAAAGIAGGYYPFTNGMDACVCVTQPGWFWDPSDTTAKLCDADGDGWINFSAATYLSLDINNPNDRAVKTNWRCSPHTIASYTLETVFGDPHVATLPAPVVLVESNRNDDQTELDATVNMNTVPQHGGRRLRASEVNSLTRACISVQADINGNGVDDVRESHTVTTTPTATDQQWVDFSYFMELHTGAFEPSLDGSPGTYRIKEKQRGGGVGEVGPVYADASGYWAECSTRPDSAFQDGLPAHGMDFARFEPRSGFAGMNHHSQFKCILIVDTATAGAPPNQLTSADFRARGYINNTCGIPAASTPVAPAQTPNPHDVPVTCSVGDTGAALANGTVVWAAMPYAMYGSSSAYTRGCVDECRETTTTCPHCPNTGAVCDRPDYCISLAYGEFATCECPAHHYAVNGVCTMHSCGDGLHYPTLEQCDLGGTNSNTPDATCRTDCTTQRCGDGIQDTGEQCDTTTFSAAPNMCHAGCILPDCGDSIIDNAAPFSEQCDTGAANSNNPNAACRTDCLPRRCGDGIVDTGEQCDRGALNANTLTTECYTDCTRGNCLADQYRNPANGGRCTACPAGQGSPGGQVTSCTTINTCGNITCNTGSRVLLVDSGDIQYICSGGCGNAMPMSGCAYSTQFFYVMCPLTSAASSCTASTYGPYTAYNCP